MENNKLAALGIVCATVFCVFALFKGQTCNTEEQKLDCIRACATPVWNTTLKQDPVACRKACIGE